MQIHPQRADTAADPSGPFESGTVPSACPLVDVGVTTSALRGVTLVQVELRSEIDEPLQVRVSNRLDGPVLPPRTEGVPNAGWDAEGFTGRLPAAGGLGVGYACPADANASDAVVSVDLRGSVRERDETTGGSGVAAAVRDLGRATPPTDAVPISDGASSSLPESAAPVASRGADVPVPSPVTEWLDAVASRIDRAEELTDATASDAVTVLESNTDDALAAIPAELATDLEALRAVTDRTERLADRAVAAEPAPVADALREAATALDAGWNPEKGEEFE
ncbi:MAG: hypothetical protein ABEI27_01990 [Halobellus sp.]|uniref:DUF7857 domain-containing protein n=1 Tax=Halobellus sp. TaxID=1979212 RepID=UPI0035D489E3